MSFNTALSGLRAASTDLEVSGNNIANASTAGFKRSRAEFADVFASSVVGSSGSTPGSGVLVSNVSQQFSQGNINFTGNSLDLAINGSGFFIMNDAGSPTYSRAGIFGTDKDGFIVDNGARKLQGFSADENGNIVSGVQTDLQVDTSNQAPRQTTSVATNVNVNATDTAPVKLVATSDDNTQVLVPNVGTQNGYDAGTLDVVTATGTTSLNIGSVADASVSGTTVPTLASLAGTININGTPVTLDNTTYVTLVDSINAETGNTGVSASIDLSNNLTLTSADDFILANGTVNIADLGTGITVGTVVEANATARQIASELNSQSQANNLSISASAHTQVRLENISGAFTTGQLTLTINPGGAAPALGIIDLVGTSSSPLDIATAINDSRIAGVTAVVNGSNVDITAANGEDLVISNSALGAQSVDMRGLSASSGALEPIAALPITVAAGGVGVIAGEVDIVVPDSTSLQANPIDPGNVWGNLGGNSLNTFDPSDPTTYNSATSVTIYDSLGNSHTMTEYFVKERTDPFNLGTTTNTWSKYVLIDGVDVGDPIPGSTVAGRAQFTMRFLADGTLDPSFDGPYLISNWVPLDSDGNYNGALLPQNVSGGGVLPIPDPVNSSNFEIGITNSTQFGSPFGVASNQQDGYSTGQLIGLDIDQTGILFARFSNGQSQILGQLALADFPNPQGLQPNGDSQWVESFDSGQPNIGTPGTTALGLLQSGALEESNVDLSDELVNLIIAQRNYQANAKTIETENQITQTIINLR